MKMRYSLTRLNKTGWTLLRALQLVTCISLISPQADAAGRDVPPKPALQINTAVVAEDGAVDIHMYVQPNGGPQIQTTLSISGISPEWSVADNGGTYNARTGLWTLALPAGIDRFVGGPTFSPPLHSDVDMNNLLAVVVNTHTTSGQTSQVSVPFFTVVDALADTPTIFAIGGSVDHGNDAPLDITATLIDTDGSEELSAVLISNVPVGFALSAGTQISAQQWQLSTAQLPGLTVSSPQDYIGSVQILVEAIAEEVNFSGVEIDFSNNIASNMAMTEVVWNRVPCDSDTNNDTWVDVDDLLNVINAWGACVNCVADIAPPSGNDVVDVDDLLSVIEHWGQCR
jgi:hypothetical protein